MTKLGGGAAADNVESDDWTPATTLSGSLPVRLLRAREAIMQFYRPLFRETGITERQWRVLRNLYDEAFLEPSELAARAFMQPPNVSRVVNELKGLGFVERVVSEQDQRRARVMLTPNGRRATIGIGLRIEARTAELARVPEMAEFVELARLLDVVIDLPLKYPELATGTSQPPGP